MYKNLRMNKILYFIIAIISSCICVSEGGVYSISDDRIRSLDINPVLGRGYSVMTNQFYSTCLVVESITVPSYNYDYFFTDFSDDKTIEQHSAGRVAKTFGFIFTRGKMSRSFNNQVKTRTKTRTISATMRIERYYASVQESNSKLAVDAKTLLDAEDYAGFFLACGPNYTRGIRRAQEITAVFQFKSSSKEETRKFSASMKVRKYFLFRKTKRLNTAYKGSSKFNSEAKSLKISIQGYGLGLNQDGSESLVASNFDEYDRVMNFAFNAMTKGEGYEHVGMVYGIELSPWVNNVNFQVAAKLHSGENIVTIPRTLIPKAFMSDPNATPVDFTNSTRSQFRCKEPAFEIDKYGYCCEPEQLFDRTDGDYDPNTPWDRICKPVRQLDRSLLKDTMTNNGEFVSRLGAAMRTKLTQISATEKCISAAYEIPSRYEFNILKTQDSVPYDGVMETAYMTLYDLKTTLDPLGDYSIVKHLTKELDEWIEMFYSPCFAALYGTNSFDTPDVDVSFFMAYPWYSHEACMKLSCLTKSMRWDRERGGCIPSLISGVTAPGYNDGADGYCSSNLERTGDSEECKYSQTDLRDFHADVTNCWRNTAILSAGSIDHFIEYYCMPEVTRDTVSDTTRQAMIDARNAHC